MSDLIIRHAERRDLEALVDMMADDMLGREREDTSRPLAPGYLAAFDAITGQPDQHLVVAEQDGKVVGMLQLSFTPGLARKGAWRGTVEGVRVHSDHRSQGIGARLIDWCVETARARGDCPFLQLTTDKSRADAQRFYLRCGFKPSHEGMKLPL